LIKLLASTKVNANNLLSALTFDVDTNNRVLVSTYVDASGPLLLFIYLFFYKRISVDLIHLLYDYDADSFIFYYVIYYWRPLKVDADSIFYYYLLLYIYY
jgi:hypothetical protein